MAVSVLDRAGVRPAADTAPTLEAYEAFAPFYDLYTADYAHETWLGSVERLAREHGLSGRRLLDVACGTGCSFAPMLDRGYDVTACDLSPAMVDRARERLGGDPRRAFVADMRALPPLGEFDLVTCLDDSVNYLLSDEDLRAALAGMSRALRPGGVLVFDVNSLLTYRTAFASAWIDERDWTVFAWFGEATEDAAPGERCVASLEISFEDDDGGWRRMTTHHVQRHHPRPVIEAACAAARLDLVGLRGMLPGGGLALDADESLHHKIAYVARKPGARNGSQRGGR